MSQDREHATWDDFGAAINSLTEQVVRSGFEPDCILTIIRGGLAVGGPLSYRLSVKDVQAINVEFYAGTGMDDVQLDEPRLLPPGIDLTQFTDKKVLVVDDVADSGTTLAFVLEKLSGTVAESRSAVWFHKPRSVVLPDFVVQRTEHWIVFPWSPFSTESLPR